MPSNHLILCHLSPCTFDLSQHQGLSQWVSSSCQVVRYWSFIFSFSPAMEYSGLISFRFDWFDLLTVQGTLKSILQCHSIKAWIRQCPTFFIDQLSCPYMTIGKTIALTRWTFISKVMFLLLNMLLRLLIAFLPRSKSLLISWLQSPSAVILEHPPNKVCHCFQCFPIYLLWSDGARCHDLSFWNADFFSFIFINWRLITIL